MSLGNSESTTVTLGDGGHDTVIANAAGFFDGNVITVGNGNDTVTAGANSIITVGNGVDNVTAGPGSTITLGGGDDMVTAINSLINGGNGHDTFVFTGSFGNDTIKNFNPLHDQIVLAHSMFADFDALLESGDMTQQKGPNGPNTVITIDASDTITLMGVDASSLHAGDFQFL